jgi:hypothetical protein
MLKLLLWIVRKLSSSSKKAIVLDIIDDIVFDDYTASVVSSVLAKSSHNKITAYIVRD